MSYVEPTTTGSISGLSPPQKLKPKVTPKAPKQPHVMQKPPK